MKAPNAEQDYLSSQPWGPMSTGQRPYLFSYRHDGAEWSFKVWADSPEDARARVSKIAYATYDGELIAELPVRSGFLAKASVWLHNTWVAIRTGRTSTGRPIISLVPLTSQPKRSSTSWGTAAKRHDFN